MCGLVHKLFSNRRGAENAEVSQIEESGEWKEERRERKME